MSALERSPPESRVQLTLQRIQGLSMLVFYPLEYVSFLSAPFAPLIRPSVLSPEKAALAGLWSIRAWGVYVVCQVLVARNDYVALLKKEKLLAKSVLDSEKEKFTSSAADLEAIRKKKTALRCSLIANISRLPVILHWCVSLAGFFALIGNATHALFYVHACLGLPLAEYIRTRYASKLIDTF